MDDLRNSIRKALEANSLVTSIMPGAFVLTLLYPGLSFINSINRLQFFVVIRSLLYVFYLVGLLISFAEGMDWAIGAAFGLLGMQYLISMIRSFTFNSLVYTLFYLCLAVYFIRSVIFRQQFNNTFNSPNGSPGVNNTFMRSTQNTSVDNGSAFCPSCGKPIDPSGSFCPFCGSPYPTGINRIIAPSQTQSTVNHVQYSGPVAEIAAICGSMLALVFSVLISANALLNLIANFNLFTVIAEIPVILICIACWIIYTSCVSGTLNESGFALIGGVLVAELILCNIPFAFGGIAGIILMFQGDELIGVGLGILIGCIIAMCLYSLFWNGLRKTVSSARMILRGSAIQWQTSLYCIVCICIGAFSQLASLASRSTALSYLSQVIGNLSYELYYATGSKEISDMVTKYLYSLMGTTKNSLADFNIFLSIAVSVCSAIILIQIRNKNKINY